MGRRKVARRQEFWGRLLGGPKAVGGGHSAGGWSLEAGLWGAEAAQLLGRRRPGQGVLGRAQAPGREAPEAAAAPHPQREDIY